MGYLADHPDELCVGDTDKDGKFFKRKPTALEIQQELDGELTPEQELQEKVKSMTDAVQIHLDTTAQLWGYDHILSLCSYEGNSDPKYSVEGAAGKEWRSSVWRYCENELVKIAAEDRLEPESNEAFIAELPTITRPKT